MTPASSMTQGLNNEVCMEALKRQLKGRIVKKQGLVVLIVMGPTVPGSSVVSTLFPLAHLPS